MAFAHSPSSCTIFVIFLNLFLVTAVALTSPACLIFFSSTLLIFDTTSATSVLTFRKERDHPDVLLSPPLKLHLSADISEEKNPAERCRISLFCFFFGLGYWDEFHGIWVAVMQHMTNEPDNPRTRVERTLDWPWGCHDELTLCQLILCPLNQGFSL